MSSKLSDVSFIKSKANSLMKNGKYLEAIVEYSQAISIQPSNPILYTNRSLAFLKLSQYFFAVKDAETAISLVPDWSKGYYRKGQAEYGAESYGLAISTFKDGLKFCPNDEILTKAMTDAVKKEKEYKSMRFNTLTRYSSLFAVVCLILVLGDMVAHPYSSLVRTPILRPFLVLFAGLIGFIVGYLVLAFQQATRVSLLDPPPELLQDTNTKFNVSKRVPSTTSSEKRATPVKMKSH